LKVSLSSESEIQFGPIRPGDVERSLLNADRLVELLGPTVAIETGLEKTAQWFRQRQQH
jgi:dTDP-D-glucose 4,6-dehydratase